MSQLQNRIQFIMDRAIAEIASAFQNSTAAEIAGVTGARHVAPVARQEEAPKARPGRKPGGPSINRQELNGRILEAILTSPAPMGLGAVAKELGVDATHVAPGIKTLRDEGKIQKHGDKRSATYSGLGAHVTDPVGVLEASIGKETIYDHTPKNAEGEEWVEGENPAPVNGTLSANRYVKRKKAETHA